MHYRQPVTSKQFFTILRAASIVAFMLSLGIIGAWLLTLSDTMFLLIMTPLIGAVIYAAYRGGVK